MITAPSVIRECLDSYGRNEKPDHASEKAAVKTALAQLSSIAPGHSVEVRIPPYAAVQVVAGVKHRRGTPPALVECDARTWLLLVTGEIDWSSGINSGALRASGERSDLSALLPLWRELLE